MTKFPVTSTPTGRPVARPPTPSPARVARPSVDGLRWNVSPLAVTAWMLVQVGCLALGLLQVPLSASYPAGSTILPELLIAGQIGFAALLAPLLARSVATIVVVALSNWPAILLAGGLAARPVADTLLAGGVVTAWTLALYFWIACLNANPLRQLVSGIATLIAVGSALLAYLVMEFGPANSASNAVAEDAGTTLDTILSMTPLLLGWNYAGGGDAGWARAMPLLLVTLLGAAVWLSRRCSTPTAAM